MPIRILSHPRLSMNGYDTSTGLVRYTNTSGYNINDVYRKLIDEGNFIAIHGSNKMTTTAVKRLVGNLYNLLPFVYLFHHYDYEAYDELPLVIEDPIGSRTKRLTRDDIGFHIHIFDAYRDNIPTVVRPYAIRHLNASSGKAEPSYCWHVRKGNKFNGNNFECYQQRGKADFSYNICSTYVLSEQYHGGIPILDDDSNILASLRNGNHLHLNVDVGYSLSPTWKLNNTFSSILAYICGNVDDFYMANGAGGQFMPRWEKIYAIRDTT